MIRHLIITLSLVAGLSFMAAPAPAQAADLFNGVQCSGKAAKSAVCKDKNPDSNPVSGKNGVLLDITYIVSVIAGMAAIIMLLVGSIRYITASGDANAVSTAKKTIIYALAGIVIIAVSASLITFVVNRI